jgi:phosphoribosylcarboxyaminoimidazole (NCAIR) mutase
MSLSDIAVKLSGMKASSTRLPSVSSGPESSAAFKDGRQPLARMIGRPVGVPHEERVQEVLGAAGEPVAGRQIVAGHGEFLMVVGRDGEGAGSGITW